MTAWLAPNKKSKIIKVVGVAVVFLALAFFIFQRWFYTDDGFYEVAVLFKDQGSGVDDLKAGDVALIKEAGQDWSNTEKISYLLLKMEINEDQSKTLLEPEVKRLSEEEVLADGLISEEALASMSEEDKKKFFTEVIQARRYRIKIEELDFDPMKIRNSQPFPRKRFDWSIVEEK